MQPNPSIVTHTPGLDNAQHRRTLVVQMKANEERLARAIAIGYSQNLNGQASASGGSGSGSTAAAMAMTLPDTFMDSIQWSVDQAASPATVLLPEADEEDSDLAGGDVMEQDVCMVAAGSRDLSAIVLRAPCVTLLLPRDDRSLLGHDSVTLLLPPDSPGFSCQQCLDALHGYYMVELTGQEQQRVMRHAPHLRRALQNAFLTMKPVPRLELLGSRTGFTGFRRVGRQPGLAVYEALLFG
ncbi:MAG: hypothetical protein WDW36_005682 [Sanguina aurantia]